MRIWKREFWRSYWISFRRAGKDKRARSTFLAITYFLVLVPAYIAFIVLTATADGGFTAALYAFILGTGTTAAIIIRRAHKRQDELLEFSLTGQDRRRQQDPSGIPAAVCSYLEERAVIIASLLARGGSELNLQHIPLPPGAEIVTRQIQNGLLRERGLWQKLEQPEADLTGAPDGCWSVEQRTQVVTWCEQLRLLRWVLGIDGDLLPLAHCPTLDFSLSAEVLRQARAPVGRKSAVASWDVRVQRDVALEYAARVLAELRARGLTANSPEFEGWADEFRAKSLGNSTDDVAGPKTIAELDGAPLQLLGLFATARERYASYLVDQLNAVQPLPFSTWLSSAVRTGETR
jgi:hypothetical protein